MAEESILVTGGWVVQKMGDEYTLKLVNESTLETGGWVQSKNEA